MTYEQKILQETFIFLFGLKGVKTIATEKENCFILCHKDKVINLQYEFDGYVDKSYSNYRTVLYLNQKPMALGSINPILSDIYDDMLGFKQAIKNYL